MYLQYRNKNYTKYGMYGGIGNNSKEIKPSQNGGLVSTIEVKKIIKYISDKNLVTEFFNKSLDLKKREEKKHFDLQINKKLKYTISLLLNNYEYLNPVSITFNKDDNTKNIITKIKTREESTNPLWKISKIVMFFDKKADVTILQYQNISRYFLFYYEVIYKNINIKNKDILDVSSRLGPTECIYFLHKRDNIPIKSNDFMYLKCNIYGNQIEEQDTINTLYKRIDPSFTYKTIQKFPNYEEFSLYFYKKYDIIFLTPMFSRYDFGYFWEHANTQSNITFIIQCLQYLHKKGTLVLRLTGLKTLFNIDCVYLLDTYFENVSIYEPDSIEDGTKTYAFIICKNFKGISKQDITKYNKLIDHMYNYDNTGGSKFNILDKEQRKEYGVTKEITEKELYYYTRIFSDTIRNTKKYKKVYEMCIEYNKNTYSKLCNFYEKEYFYMEDIVNNNQKVLQELKRKQLVDSIQYAEKYDLSIKPIISIDKTKKDIFQSLLKRIQEKHTSLHYTFSVPLERYSIKKYVIENPELLSKFTNKYDYLYMIMDTRDKGQYGEYSYYLKFYRNFHVDINSQYNTKGFTQAGLKLYEILQSISLVPNKKTLNSFHLCELPGSFIFSLDYFIQTQNIQEWDWISQSLKTGFKDEYHLVRDFPEHWDFGKTKDGDITNIQNIEHYIQSKKLHNADIITSDCGLSREFMDKTNQLFFASIMIVLSGSKKGANYIQKIYVPLNNLLLSLLYICFSHYKEVFFYKPVVNQYSGEMYFVCKDFQGITKSKKDSLLKTYKGITDFNEENISLVKNFSSEFLNKVEEGLMLFLDKLYKNTELSLDVSDFFSYTKNQKFKKEFLSIIKEEKKKKRKEWKRNYFM